MHNPGLVLGVDIGTSSTKGVLVGRDGSVRHTVTVHHEVDRPVPGHVEMDGHVWWDEFCQISSELASVAAQSGESITAVGVSGMGPCALLTDAAGVPLRPAILYGVDTRATQQIERLRLELREEGFGDDELLAATGSLMSSQAIGPKLAWIADEEPEIFEAAHRMFMPASWLAFQLTGAYVLDHHSASQCTPMYDTARETWHEVFAPRLAGNIALPELRWPGELAGSVTSAAASATGIPEGTPVITGTIDAWSEAVSVGAQTPGDLMLMYGTTFFMISTGTTMTTHPALWGTVGAFQGTRNVAAGMATSGAITNWIRDLTGADFQELLAEAEDSGLGARGLLMLPYFAGERTPINDPHARGVVAGLTIEHTRGDLYRAALEATAFGVRHNVEQMREAGAQIDRIVAVGGGTTSLLWPQIISDVTGLTQEIPTHTIGASLGAAFLAASLVANGSGDAPSIEDWNPTASEIHPDEKRHTQYTELFADYLALYPATAAIAHRLASRQHEAAQA